MNTYCTMYTKNWNNLNSLTTDTHAKVTCSHTYTIIIIDHKLLLHNVNEYCTIILLFTKNWYNLVGLLVNGCCTDNKWLCAIYYVTDTTLTMSCIWLWGLVVVDMKIQLAACLVAVVPLLLVWTISVQSYLLLSFFLSLPSVFVPLLLEWSGLVIPFQNSFCIHVQSW